MDKSFENEWRQYLQTPRSKSGPVKLDRILAERMRAFLRARNVKPYRVKVQRRG